AIGELRGEFVSLDALQGAGQAVDRVVLHRARAVAAGVGDFEAIVLRGLLTGLDLESDPVPLVVQLAPGTLIESELRIDELALMLAEPLRSVEGAAGFLTAREGELQGAARLEVLLFEANQRIDPDRRLGLVVDGAARVKVTVLLDELERIAGPVLALRFDDIDVSEQQNRFQLRVLPRIDEHQ